MHVLLSAYACRPGSGTEAGNGWGWATNLAARGLRVHVLTVASSRDLIEAELQTSPVPGLSFSFVEPARKIGYEGGGSHYLAWQFAALKAARRLHRCDPFDVAHHVTYGSIHVPSQLWRLKIPVIFGPVGGGQTSPYSMRSYFGADQRNELIRTITTLMLPYSPLHRYWMGRMAVVLATNDETLSLMRRLGRKDAVLSMDTGLPEAYFAKDPRRFFEQKGPPRLLWVGRMLPRKALALTLDALAQTKVDLTLTVLGDGLPEKVVRQMIMERELGEKVIWSGKRSSWSEVREAYQVHDAFLFNSLRDSMGSQLLEAMALGLPIITLDHQGAHSLVPSEAGIKVPVSDRATTIRAISHAIETFALLPPQAREAMSIAGWNAARKLAWGPRTQRAEDLYRRVVSAYQTPGTRLGSIPGVIEI